MIRLVVRQRQLIFFVVIFWVVGRIILGWSVSRIIILNFMVVTLKNKNIDHHHIFLLHDSTLSSALNFTVLSILLLPKRKGSYWIKK